MMTSMAAAVKSGEFRAKYLNTMRTMLGWKLMQTDLEKKNRSGRQKILSESFHQKELETGIEEACKLGMMEAVKFLIEECDINVEKVKHLCVWSAASKENSNIVKYFLENYSIDVNMENDKGTRVIHFACLAGDVSLAEYLINKGADMTAVDSNNVNSLMAAAWAGSLKICEMAVRAGVDVNAKSSSGEHILHGTIRHGNNLKQSRLDVIHYLVKAGADVNSVNGSNISVVMYAAIALNGSTKTLGYFLKHPEVDVHEKIDAIKLGGAFLITKGNERRGFKFWIRAIEFQEKLNIRPEIQNSNSDSCAGYFSSYEPVCVADIQKLKRNPVFPIKLIVALMTKLHVKYGHDCIHQLESLMDVIVSLGYYDFYLEVFVYVFLHIFPDNGNVNYLQDFRIAFRIICAIVAWKNREGDEIFPAVLNFFEKMTNGFENKQFCCRRRLIRSVRDLSQSQRELRSMIMNVLDFFSPSEAEDDNDSDGYCVNDDYKDGKQKNLYMKLMIKLGALIFEIFPTHKEEFIPCLLKLLKTNFRDEKQSTFLHIAINCIDTNLVYHGNEDSQADLVKKLIEYGEDVNATDKYLCTPVHDLARVVYSGNRNLIQEVLNLMVKYGAHLDIRNKTGWSGLDELIDFEVTVHPVANQSLQCLAAKVIMEEKLSYRSCVPKALWDFIELHDPEEHIMQDDIPYAYFSQEQFWFSPEEHVCDI